MTAFVCMCVFNPRTRVFRCVAYACCARVYSQSHIPNPGKTAGNFVFSRLNAVNIPCQAGERGGFFYWLVRSLIDWLVVCGKEGSISDYRQL